ncbi:MAG: flavodoxin-dependent (E)-4-hydroxy-3-methylbut-2-enyl-diphosphate synthase [Lachnospiraceae bacterium]|nr:flavodoxin-dependent (E)-4-hydroxy-3-methylbut-2-enyl-diphosphate synthase [Lachnospiraceae bacterium]
MYREMTREVRIGDRLIGHGHPILIQSMTNTRTSDVRSTVDSIRKLEEAGCEIIRVTVPDRESAMALSEIRKAIRIPLVADIHFDYRLAVMAAENGADKIRINPGNIGGNENVLAVVNACRTRSIPIRVGVNSGSLEKVYIEKYGSVTAEGLVESAMEKVRLLESMDFGDIVVSIKSSDVMMCVDAYRKLAEVCLYPLHVGITEAGGLIDGNIKSAIGIGLILSEGIGDTIRVSLTGDPLEEIRSAKTILRTLKLRKGGIEVVSCPTCGRTKIDLIGLAAKVEEMVKRYPDLDLKVAVMGCVVNGPGEAKEADLAICGGDHVGLVMKKGEILKKVREEELLGALENELANYRKV